MQAEQSGVEHAQDESIDWSARLPGGSTIHKHAFHGDCAGILTSLEQGGNGVNALCDAGYTPLILAVEQAHPAVVSLLIACKANPNCVTKRSECTPLMLCAMRRSKEYTDILRILIQADANINAVSRKGNTALMLAVKREQVANVEKLCQLGADLDVANNKGHTAVMLSIFADHVQTLEVLHKHGAALHHTHVLKAVKIKHDGVFDYLMQQNLAFDAKDPKGCTTLLTAMKYDNMYALMKLCQAGADVNIQDDDGQTPLMHTVHAHDKDSVLQLCQAGAAVNVQDKHKRTALIHAVAAGQTDIMVLLCEFGTDISIEGTGGTALQIAEHTGQHEHCEILRTWPVIQRMRAESMYVLTSRLERLEAEMMCAICLEVVRDPATIVDCQHTFCRGCLHNPIKEIKQCPTCKRAISQLQKNHMLANASMAVSAPAAKRARR